MASLLREGLPIRLRLALAYALLLAGIVAAVGTYLLADLQNTLRQEVDDSLALHAIQLERALLAAGGEGALTADASQRVLAELGPAGEYAAPNIYVQVLAADGTPLASSENLPGAFPIDDEVSTAVAAGEPAFADLWIEGERLRVLVHPVGGGERRLGFLLLGESMHTQERALDRIRNILLLAGTVGALVALLGGWLLTGRAMGPILEVTRVARHIAATGRFEQRIAVPPRRDELGELTMTFNDMLARLEHTFQHQREFLADASHELRGPLMVIRGNLDLLNLDLPEEERLASVQEATEEVTRMANLVGDLLFLAEVDAPETVRHTPVNLDEVVAAAVARARDVDGGRHMLVLPQNDRVVVSGDRERLGQLLWNMIENALRYTPEGGKVAVSLRGQGPVAEMMVADSGIGICPEHLPRIFERFYRVDRARSRSQDGTGLGLAIVKQIAEAHGGQVRVRSEPGAGSTFTVVVPVLVEEDSRP